MNKRKLKELLVVQHSVYTALTSLLIAEYHIDFVASQDLKTNKFLSKKSQDRFLRIVRQIRTELLNSAKDAYARQDIVDSLTQDRIEALSSIMMMINRLEKVETIEKFEEQIADVFKNS